MIIITVQYFVFCCDDNFFISKQISLFPVSNYNDINYNDNDYF